MANLTEFFIEKPLILIVLTFILTFGGMVSYINLNRNEDPGFKIRTASIVTSAESLNAKQVDSYITRPIENILLEMEEIEDIREESMYGKSVIYADLYETYDDIQPIWDRLRRKIELAKNYIPNNLSPFVNDEFADVYGALIGISKEGADYEELYDVTEKIRDEFLKLKTRGKVEIIGKQEETLYIRFKNAYLANLKLTPLYLKNMVGSINVINGGGYIESPFNFIEISSKNFFQNASDVKNTPLNIGGNPLYMGDIFKIEKTIKKPINHLVRSNGKDALILAISLKKDGNILKWGDEIRAKTNELKKRYKDLKIEILALQSDYVKKLTDKFVSSLFESILAVILTVFVILGAKTAFIIGMIIFVTVLSVFLLMYCFNIGLDKISLSALIISLGILVDNSIVVAQGSLLYDENKNIKEHIIKTATNFKTPLLVVTLTTSLAFLPVLIAKSTVSEYASNMPKVVFMTLMFSWFYSISLLPYLMYKIGHKDAVKKKKNFLVEFLKNKIPFFVNNPKKTLLFTVLVFIFSLFAFYFVPKIFFPDSDRNAFEIRLNLKNGASFEEMKNAVFRVEDFLKNEKDVINFSSYIGTSAPRYVLSASPEADRTNFSMVLVNTKKYETVESDIKNAKNFINKNLPNVQAVVRKIPLGPPYDAPVEIRIKDNDINNLFNLAKLVEEELSKIKGVYLVKNNWGESVFEYSVKVNNNAAINSGVDPSYLFDYLNTVYNGKNLTFYYRNDVKVPVVLMGDEAFVKDSNSINSISFYSMRKNGIIPLSQIAKVTPSFTYSKILRRNNSYVLTVQGWLNDSITAKKAVEIIEPKLKEIKGLDYEFGGIVEKSKKGNNSVIQKVPVAFGAILLILVVYFNSLKKPLLIAFCAIMALFGANFGLLITRMEFGFMTFLGYICLVGICMNNGVVLLSEINDSTKTEVIKTAQSRVEPVILTCLTTIGGMLPLWLKNDPMFSGLAVAIIFGLLASIFVTLFLLPSLYSLYSE